MSNLIEIKNLSKIYNKGQFNQVEALKDINLTVKSGFMLAVMGVSGSGKSTLLNIIGLLDKPTQGNFLLGDINVESLSSAQRATLRSDKIGFVMQENSLLNRDTVYENLKVPLIFSNKFKTKQHKSQIKQTLETVGISDLSKRKVMQLSGGQKQRVSIARAIINNPDLILADEPTSALDSHTASEIITLFKQQKEQGKTIIVVTHDIAVANQMDAIVYIKDGLITEQKS